MYRKKNIKNLSSVFFQLPETLLFVMAYDSTILQASQAWTDHLGHSVESLLDNRFLDLVHPDDRAEAEEVLVAVAASQETARFPVRCRRADGTYLGLTWNITAARDQELIFASAHETAVTLVGQDGAVPDVYLDGLTGLPNRSLFLDRLEHSWERTRRRDEFRFAVLHVGLDRFKVINDSLGHRVGDILLADIGALLKTCIRPTDMVARLGGDEFAILLEDIRDATSTIRVVNRIHEKLRLPFTLNEHEVFTSVSIGIAVSGGDDRQPDQFVRDANIAMYRAKSQGGGSYVVFDKAMHDQAVHRLELEMDLRRAVERGEFQAYYQPIVTLATGRLAGFEALVRWRHPSKGLISPLEFIPIAEETGMIVPIGLFMLREACRQTQAWHAEFPALDLTVSVNLSPKQLRNPGMLQDVADTLAETGFAPHRLKLEITESAIIEDAEEALTLLRRIKDSDIQLSLDDFGTGYSSLSYLHRLPIDVLKVDRSFIIDIEGNEMNRGFVSTIISLARQLKLAVVCEGIETRAQADILTAMGCQYGQGYLYSRPVAEHEARILICNDLAPCDNS